MVSAPIIQYLLIPSTVSRQGLEIRGDKEGLGERKIPPELQS